MTFEVPGGDRARLGLDAARLDRAVDQRAALERGLGEPLAERVEEREDALSRVEAGAGRDLAQPGRHAVAAATQERGDERLLGVEVAVQRDLRDAGLGGELVDADGQRALLVEHARGGVEDAGARGRGVERLALGDRHRYAAASTTSGRSRCTEWPAPSTVRYVTCGLAAPRSGWVVVPIAGSPPRISVGNGDAVRAGARGARARCRASCARPPRGRPGAPRSPSRGCTRRASRGSRT